LGHVPERACKKRGEGLHIGHAGTPLMLQLLVVYFGPFYLFRVSISSAYRFVAVIIDVFRSTTPRTSRKFPRGHRVDPARAARGGERAWYSKAATFVKIIFAPGH
jgi:hypothetical protein